MINALEGFTEEWFTPPGEADEAKPTRFKIKPLDGEQFTNMQLMMDGSKLTGDTVTYALQTALVDWENFSNSQGPVPCTLQNHKLLPMPVRIDIASKIYEISMLSGAQIKNS